MLSAALLNVILLSVILLSVILLNVVAPSWLLKFYLSFVERKLLFTQKLHAGVYYLP